MRSIVFAMTMLAIAFVPFQSEKGDGDNLCEAPLGPFRQMVPVPFFSSDGQQKKEKDALLDEMMQKKLKSAQLVLDGVVSADFKKTQSNAEELIRLANSTTWPLILSPQYDEHNADFLRSAKKLVQTSKDKNTEGAALAYVEMTLSCVRCHQFVRDQRR